MYIVYDRLSHQGGISGTVTTEQTTNLPTAALTRYTSGVGVMAMLEIYATIGSTATTYSLRYTNQAGVANRNSPLQTVGGSSDRGIGLSFFTPLQVGDTGVRSVEGITLSATTGTAGDMGITLWRPLFSIPSLNLSVGARRDAVRHYGAMFSAIEQDACLAVMYCASAGDTYAYSGALDLIKQV